MTCGRPLAVLVSLAAALSSSSVAQPPDNGTPRLVSLVRLLAVPEAFDRKLVRVAGYCHLEFEGDALYLHREDYSARLPVNAVRLDLGDRTRESFPGRSGHYVLAEGTFSVADPRDPRPYVGVLRVTSIDVLPPRERR
jgi:hypothetical protein